MKQIAIALSLILISTSSCKNQKAEVTETPTKMEEVLAIHDEVMPKMATIAKLVEKLKSKTDSTGNNKKYKDAMTDLQEAHTSMMDWMKGFGERFDHEEVMKGKPLSEEKKVWLAEEEQKVKAMREKVLKSISNAQQVLQN